MPQSTDYYPQRPQVPTRSFADEIPTAASVTLLTSVCSMVLPLNFPDIYSTFGVGDLCLSSVSTESFRLTLCARTAPGHRAIHALNLG